MCTGVHGEGLSHFPQSGIIPVYSGARLQTCEDIHRCRAGTVDKQFGLHSLRVYLGVAPNVVEPWACEGKKSISSERYLVLCTSTELERVGPSPKRRRF
jgi:hypothetical protein